MGKYTDTDSESNSSSNENLKKKRKPSILKYTSASAKRSRKCKIHAASEPDDSEPRSRSLSRGRGKKLRGILKHKSKYYSSSEEDEESDFRNTLPPDKFLVGRVPLPPGSKPGRGGGVALLVRKSAKYEQKFQPKETTKTSSHKRQLTRKRSY
ncbi:hypothetical protein NE865_11083 [Phthorimaea operculella]|nr:hypothetical protein NE865_11083 [Phthorimaea operculella]